MRLTILLYGAFFALFCCGCLPLTHYKPRNADAEGFAKRTLDMKDSSPALVFAVQKSIILKMLRDMGADDYFDDGFYDRSIYLRDVRYVYLQEGIIEQADDVLLCTDDVMYWLGIMVVKEREGKTLVWIRRPTCRPLRAPAYEPPADSQYDRDWPSDIREESARRGITVLDQ